jgi:peptide deformylase
MEHWSEAQLEEEVLRLLATAQRQSMTAAELALSDRLLASMLDSSQGGGGAALAAHQCALQYTLDCVVLSLERDAAQHDAVAVQELSQVMPRRVSPTSI